MTCRPHPRWKDDGRDWPNREASQFVETGQSAGSNNIRWHYQRMGQGPVLLLLHGAGAATHSWRDLMPLLARDFDVIAPDLPGHGFTRIASRSQCSLPNMAAAVRDLVHHLEVTPTAMIGHSAGTAIALQCLMSGEIPARTVIGLNAALAPFRGIAGVLFPPLAKVLALNPFVPWMFSRLANSEAQARKLIDSTGSKIDETGHAMYRRLFASPDHVDGALSMMALWDLDPLISGFADLKRPVHLMVGEHDRTVPPDEAMSLAERYPAISAHAIPALGHLMHEEDPALFAQRIKSIIGDVG